MGIEAAYEELIRRSRERALLGSCSALLGWDEQTNMPPEGAAHRGEQLALLAGLHHERAIDPRIGDLLAEVEGSGPASEPGSPPAVNAREWRRQYERATRLPRSLVEELARTTTLAQQEWIAARRADDFARFLPWLERVVELKRGEAGCLGGDEPYDGLLDEYEPGARARDLAPLFESLRRELVPLVEAIAASPRRPDPSILRREYPIDRQRVFAEAVAAAAGFDFRAGRLDTAAHPFCTGIGPGDCRLTTRYDPHGFGDAFFGTLHEVGHGLYDQGLDPGHFGTPMGEAISLGVHESQSRLWENAVGRGRPFWDYWFPMAQRVFPGALRDVDADRFHFAINGVEPSLIRVGADEVTYNLHVLVRFELERALIAGDLAAADVPGAWAEGYRRNLGIAPDDDADGCLQDVHWSAGLIGYFPTYTLGNLYAAQLFARAVEDLGDLDAAFARGDLAGLLGWLRDRVHRHGQRHRPADLVRGATGAAPDPRFLVEALRAKYGLLYGSA